MLEQMRQATKNPILLLAFGILIVVFALYFGQGTEMLSASGRQVVATVDGDDLYTTDVDVFSQRYAPRQTRNNEAELVKFQQYATEVLALMHVLEKDAKAYGIDVTDQELGQYIQDRSRNGEAGIYAKDGEFDAETYQKYASNYLGLSLENYEAMKRRELIVQKYLLVLSELLVPLPANDARINELKNTKVVLEYIALDPKKLEDSIKFTDAEVETFANANPAKIQKYYDDNKDKEFTAEKELRYRLLFVNKKADPSAAKKPEDAWKEAKERVLTKKEDFAKVVQDLSDDTVYKTKGGDMGWAKASNIDVDTVNVLNSMKPGDVKDFEKNLAWYLVKLEEVKEAKVTPLSEVRTDIAKKLIFQEEGKKRIEEATKTLFDLAKASPKKPLEEILASAKPKAPEAPKDTDPKDKDDQETPAETPAGGIWDALQVATTPETARYPRRTFRFDPETKGVVNAYTPWFTIPGIGESKDLALAAFNLTAEKPLVEKLITINDAQYIVRLKERKEPSKEELGKSLTSVKSETESMLISSFMGPWPTLFYRPQQDLKKTYPWLHSVLERAKSSGRINIRKDIYKLPVVSVTVPTGTAGAAPPATPPAK